jgi:hypothetical protein
MDLLSGEKHGLQPPPYVYQRRGKRRCKYKNKNIQHAGFLMVTNSSTSRSVQRLYMAERAGCPVFTDL